MCILVYYHDDLDGICSAAIINKLYGDSKCVPVQYGKDTWNLQDVVDAEEVFVVDFTFPDMEKLAEIAENKLRWIDHHKTAMEQHLELWNSDVKGLRDLDNSGCGLTWKYCYNDPFPAPCAVRWVEDRDLWKFNLVDTKPFCMGASILIKDPYDKYWADLLDSDVDQMCHFVEMGTILLDAQYERVKRMFEAGKDVTFQSHKTRMVNSTSDISELGEYIYSNGYDLALIWQVKENKIICSLRSKAVDCSEIAKNHGGGGHKGAAGFSIENKNNFPLELL